MRAVHISAPAAAALPESAGGDPGADRLQGQRTRTKLANALANCAVVSVQRAEQLVSLGEPSEGFANSYISQLFHRANSPDVYRTFTHSRPRGDEKKAHGRRTELLRNRTELFSGGGGLICRSTATATCCAPSTTATWSASSTGPPSSLERAGTASSTWSRPATVSSTASSATEASTSPATARRPNQAAPTDRTAESARPRDLCAAGVRVSNRRRVGE